MDSRSAVPFRDEIEIPAPKDVPWPRFSAQPELASLSSSSDESDNVHFVLGAQNSLPGRLGARQLGRVGISSLVNATGSADCIRLSDYMQMRPKASATGEESRPQLSLGSALHVGDGTNALCLVCSLLGARGQLFFFSAFRKKLLALGI